MDATRAAIDRELTIAAYEASSRARSAVTMPPEATNPSGKGRPDLAKSHGTV
ncbi:hypothetical protein RAD16_38175 [Bradyrhizobium sp. 18BD]